MKANHQVIRPRYRRGKAPRFYFADGRRHDPYPLHGADSEPSWFEYDDDDWADDELDCTFCGGDGLMENDDPLWHGHDDDVPCSACNGTGLRKHQTVF